jgi:hypothetical protein
MRNATPFLAFVLAGLFMAGPAVAEKQKKAKASANNKAQTYKWTDEQGVTHYGDSVPAEYSQREQRVLNSQGVEVQKKQAEMSQAEPWPTPPSSARKRSAGSTTCSWCRPIRR